MYVRWLLMKALVVEDDSNTRYALSRIVGSAGYTVVSAATGLDALSLANHHPIDLLVTDWDLGSGLTGLDVANYLKAHCATVPVIFITGKSTDCLTALTKTFSDSYILAKPVSAFDLRFTIRQAER